MILLSKLSPLLLGLMGTTPIHGAKWPITWQGVPPRLFVTIQGCSAPGQAKVWSTYQNGRYRKEDYSGNYFRVPQGRPLVITQAECTFSGDSRKIINLELVLNQGVPTFPLARATFCNPDGVAMFTATKAFSPGILIPGGGQVMVEDKALAPGSYEVMFYGFYLE
jgi:hypothetical protein